jgi:hypothetical protein
MSKYKRIAADMYERNGLFYKKIFTKESYSACYDKYLQPAVDSRVLYDKIANIVRIKLLDNPVCNYTEQTLMEHYIDPDTVFRSKSVFEDLVSILPELPTVYDEFECSHLVLVTDYK